VTTRCRCCALAAPRGRSANGHSAPVPKGKRGVPRNQSSYLSSFWRLALQTRLLRRAAPELERSVAASLDLLGWTRSLSEGASCYEAADGVGDGSDRNRAPKECSPWEASNPLIVRRERASERDDGHAFAKEGHRDLLLESLLEKVTNDEMRPLRSKERQLDDRVAYGHESDGVVTPLDKLRSEERARPPLCADDPDSARHETMLGPRRYSCLSESPREGSSSDFRACSYRCIRNSERHKRDGHAVPEVRSIVGARGRRRDGVGWHHGNGRIGRAGQHAGRDTMDGAGSGTIVGAAGSLGTAPTS
jgi:hypothetical protein